LQVATKPCSVLSRMTAAPRWLTAWSNWKSMRRLGPGGGVLKDFPNSARPAPWRGVKPGSSRELVLACASTWARGETARRAGELRRKKHGCAHLGWAGCAARRTPVAGWMHFLSAHHAAGDAAL
jgi:hypothetical protein